MCSLFAGGSIYESHSIEVLRQNIRWLRQNIVCGPLKQNIRRLRLNIVCGPLRPKIRRVSVKFFVKICFRLYERKASPPSRDLAIDHRDLA